MKLFCVPQQAYGYNGSVSLNKRKCRLLASGSPPRARACEALPSPQASSQLQQGQSPCCWQSASQRDGSGKRVHDSARHQTSPNASADRWHRDAFAQTTMSPPSEAHFGLQVSHFYNESVGSQLGRTREQRMSPSAERRGRGAFALPRSLGRAKRFSVCKQVAFLQRG